ncbi:MAG TPA: hypothetical protein VMN04_03535 [Thermoanaerobaculia bacterium]|nr:hypothetical protein [Thermoanaerobaculia bacterium]
MKISLNGKRSGLRRSRPSRSASVRVIPAAATAFALPLSLFLFLFTFKEDLLFASSPEEGPSRLAALLASNASEIARMKAGLAAGETRPEWTRLRAEIDAAAHQRDAAWSGLYWYTSLPEALAAAASEGKPVLSLHLLGRLDEELSCANSRFFRTALYANAAVSDELRRNWILHWESVRPAPKVTIDFGDGRVLHRTITGNSLHYVLDAAGVPRDVMPGLWGPGDFLRRLMEARAEASSSRATEGGAKAASLLDAPHRAGAPSEPFKESSLAPSSSFSLDANSLLLMRAKAPRMDDAAFARLVAAFERTLAEDTARGEQMRLNILPWLASSPSLPALTERIYREAFLTPGSDPWLGLVAPDAYSAIEGDPAPGAGGPDARRAGALTASKIALERPLLARVTPGGAPAAAVTGSSSR